MSNQSIKDIFQKALTEENRNVLTEYESKLVLKEIGIPITRMELVDASEGNVIEGAGRVGYPLVLKLIVEDISHKSDMGAVKLGITNETELKQAFSELMEIKTESKNPKISIQEMAAAPITEIIIGMTTDPQFGPALMFGIGGILVELMKDVAFRIAPITDMDAEEMIHEIKGFPLLDGFRGRKKADLDAIKETLLKISQFVLDYPEISEIDLNPVFTYENGILAVDARIILNSSN
ncbi:MAG: acetate--CoA ligase family protein [Promethearchaeota archaeon]